MIFPRCAEVTLTRDELLRSLGMALGTDHFETNGERIWGRTGWQIHITDLSPVQLGSVSLARLQLRFDFADAQTINQTVFMTQISLYLQKGGG